MANLLILLVIILHHAEMNDHLNTDVFRGLLCQIPRDAYESFMCTQVLLSYHLPSTVLWTVYVGRFGVFSTQNQVNVRGGGMGGKMHHPAANHL